MRAASRLGYALALFLLLVSAIQAPAQAASAVPREHPDLVIQTGHVREVTAVRFTPDGRLLATGENGPTVKLWDVSSGLEVRSFSHPNRLEHFCFAGKGTVLATSIFDDGGVGLWGLTSGQLEGRIETGENTVTNVGCSPDGRWLATGGGFLNQIKVWDLGSGQLVQTLEKFFGGYLEFTPDSRYLVASDFSGPITFWETGSWQQSRRLETRGNARPAVDRQGRNTDPAPSVSNTHLAWANKDGSVTLWDIARGSGRILPGEGTDLNAVALSADGSRLATATVMGRLRLLEAATGRELRVLADLKRQHRYQLAFSPDGSVLVANLGGDTGAPRLWHARTGRESHTLERRSDWVTRVRVSTDGRWLSATPYGRHVYYAQGEVKIDLKRPEDAVQIWDLVAGQTTFRLPQSLLYSPALQRWLRVGENLEYWDSLTGRVLETEKAPIPAMPNDLVLSPDGRRLAVANYQGVKLLELPGLRELLAVHQPRDSGGFSPARQQPSPRRVWLSPKGTWMISRDEEQAFLWDAATGKRLHSWSSGGFAELAFAPDESALVASSGGVSGMHVVSLPDGAVTAVLSASGAEGAVSPDGKAALVTRYGQTPTVWDPATGLVSGTVQLELGESVGGNAIFSPNGRWVALPLRSLPPGAIEVVPLIALVDSSSWQIVHRLRGHPGGSSAVAFAADGKRFLSAGRDGVHLWDTVRGSELLTLDGVSEADLSGDGRLLAGELRKERVVRLYDASSGGAVRDIPLPTPRWSVQRLALSSDGKWLAATGGEGSTYELKVWATDSGTERHGVPLGRTGADHLHFTTGAQRLLASSGKRIHHLDLASGERRQTSFLPYEFGDKGMGFSGDGRFYLLAGIHLKTIDAETGRLARRTMAPLGAAEAIAVSSQGVVALGGGWMAIGDEGAALVRLWDLKTRRELRRLRGHTGIVSDLAFTADGRLLFSASQDGSVRLWDVQSGEPLAIIPHLRGPGEWLVVTPDGLFDGSADAFKRVAWRFAGNAVSPVEPFFNDFYYPGLLGELLAGRRPKATADIGNLDRRQPEVRIAPVTAAAAPLSTRTVKLVLQVSEAGSNAQRTTGSGARDVRLFRNGSLVKLWRGDVLKGQPKVTLEVTVPIVAGLNRFTAYAFNRDNIKSADAELVVNGAESLRRKGTAYVVVIGINQYSNQDYNLRYAVADAQAFAAEFSPRQASLGEYDKVEVVSLLDAEATKDNLLAALRRLAGETAPASSKLPPILEKLAPAQPEDAVFVYYAGHGTASGPRFYLIPHDLGYSGPRREIDEAGLKTMLSGSISDRELEAGFEKIDAGRIMLVIDACNSGQALEAEEKRRGPMNSKGLAQLAYEKGMYVLAAAQGYQAALEVSQLGHGYLTYALVEEGLKTPSADSAPKDGQVFMREWLDYAALRVPQMQQLGMQDARKLGRNVAFVEGEEQIDDVSKRSLQRPRVFYRREPEAQPLIVARPEVAR